MNTLYFLAGLGTGAFVASVLLITLLHMVTRTNKAHADFARSMAEKQLAQLTLRNELLREQNRILIRK